MKSIYGLFVLLTLFAPLVMAEQGKHLFILSGQSNMARLQPEDSFIPAIEDRFGKDGAIVVFDAQGGQPIRRWYKDWKPDRGVKPDGNGDLYDRLMKKVDLKIADQEISTVTFLWMQGERDAKEGNGAVYEKSLKGLIKQLEDDLGRDDIFIVIGRLSDHGTTNQEYVNWEEVRIAQMKTAEDSKHGVWIDTDDLNDGIQKEGKEVKNDLHLSTEGYRTFGERLAEAAIGLIEQ